MVVWTPVPWKVGSAPWRQQEPTYTTTRAWKSRGGNKDKGYQQSKPKQQYHVCPSCPKWFYLDKLKQQGGLCLCGATIDHKQHHRSWAGWDLQGKVEQQSKAMEVMAVVAATLDSSQLAALRIEYPDLLPIQGKAPKGQDSFQLAVKDSSQAFRTYKKAVELKGKLQLKVAHIEQQLEDVRKELQEAVSSFELAEKEQLAAVEALALEAKKDPGPAAKEEDKGMDLDGGGKKEDEPPAGAAQPVEAAAEEPEQFKLYRATLDESAKSQLDAHLEYLGSSKKRKQESSEAKYQASMEQARTMAQGLQALSAGFDFAALAGKGKGGGGPAKAEGKGSARQGPY
jgi:hypothetical protein